MTAILTPQRGGNVSNVLIDRRRFGQELDIYLALEGADQRAVAKPIEWHEPETVFSKRRAMEPTFTMRLDEAHVLMDELWRAGVRPSIGVSSTGQSEAMAAHIEFSEKVVSDLFGMMDTLQKMGSFKFEMEE